jgi:hypothetical protein
MDEDVCDLVSYQIMVDARALGDTAMSKSFRAGFSYQSMRRQQQQVP